MVRRWLFLLVAQFAKDPAGTPPTPATQPTLLLLVPFRNEATTLPGLLTHLDQLTYPTQQLTTVLIDDGSTDSSPDTAKHWADQQPNRHLLTLSQTVGKASALNEGLAQFPSAELVAVYDADERPTPTALSQLVACFADPQLGAVSGRRTVSNPLGSLFASTSTIESLVHQLITMQAKEQLGLAPAILGSNCVYRRASLERAGGFRPGALLEDSDLSLTLVSNGWRTRFCPQAISTHAVPQTLQGHWRQHSRWSSGFRNVAQQQAKQIITNQQLSWPLRLELLAFSMGYADRVAWLIMGLWLGIKTLIIRQLPLRFLTIFILSLLTPLVQVVVALQQAQAPTALWWRVFMLPFLLPLDIAASLIGLLQRKTDWETREDQ